MKVVERYCLLIIFPSSDNSEYENNEFLSILKLPPKTLDIMIHMYYNIVKRYEMRI